MFRGLYIKISRNLLILSVLGLCPYVVSQVIEGTSSDETLTGTSGNDVMKGLDGADSLSGLGGDDDLIGGAGADVLLGGDGNDRLWGFEASLLGLTAETAANDLSGGVGNDRLFGGLGADIYRLSTGEGVDTIFELGSPSGNSDKIVFGTGFDPDSLTYERSKGDLVFYQDGTTEFFRVANWYLSDDGRYQVERFEFEDETVWNSADFVPSGTVTTGTTNGETLNGQDNVADLMYGLAGVDVIYGKSGDDVVVGGAGNDTLHGEAGADVLAGGTGDDTIYGGNGSDTYFWDIGDGNDTIYESKRVDDPTSTNVLKLGPGVLPQNVTVLDAGSWKMKLQIGAESVSFVQWYWDNFDTWNIEFADGTIWYGRSLATPGADKFVGTTGADTLSTGTGPDTINAGAGDDTLYGGTENDLLYGEDGNDTVHGENGVDTLWGGNGNDTLYGGAGNDTLWGDAGTDTLSGGAGDDVIHGGPGADTFLWNIGDGNDTVYEYFTIHDPGVVNVLKFGAGITPQDVVALDAGSWHMKLQIGTESVTIRTWYWDVFASWNIEFADGTIWYGRNLATTGEDRFVGTAGADTLSSGAGPDRINAGAGDDTLYGGTENDLLYGEDGNDTVHGENGNDTLWGGNGNDTLYGGAGNDTLWGDAGTDTLSGGAGDDVIHGGLGADTFLWNTGDGNDTVYEYFTAHDPGVVNVLKFGAGIIPQDVVLSDIGSGRLKLQIGAGSVTIMTWYWDVFASWNIEFADGTIWNGRTLATPGVDKFVGTSGADVLSSGAGADTINGGAGNDTLSGGADNDTIYGEDGNDSLYGETGNDTLWGGNGDDQSSGGDGNDTLYGDMGNDVLNGDAGVDTLYGWYGNDVLFGGEGNDVLYGEYDDDVLQGGAGDDTIRGAQGSDRYYWNLGDGNDVIHDIYNEFGVSNRLIFGAGIDSDDLLLTRVNANDMLVTVRDSNGQPIGSVCIVDWHRLTSGQRHQSTWTMEFADGMILQGKILGTDGDDVLDGSENADTLSGKGGNDTISGLGGDDTLHGGDGNDSLNGGDGLDILWGGAGNDVISGNNGDDLIHGESGNDNFYGGSGNDTYYWNIGDGYDGILDNDTEFGVVNKLVFGPGVSPSRLILTRPAVPTDSMLLTVTDSNGDAIGGVTIGNWHKSSTGGRHQITWQIEFADGTIWLGRELASQGADTLVGDEDVDVIYADGGNDHVSGNGGDDLIDGGNGADTVYGGNGNDEILGGDGDDLIFAENGDDEITGGPGNEIIHGGSGSDTYHYDYGDGDDLIYDVSAESGVANRLIFGPGILPRDLALTRVGTYDLKITLRDSNANAVGSIAIYEWHKTDHQATWTIEFADGTIWQGKSLATEGADTLKGSASVDGISSKGGDDTIYGYDGNDELDGETGNDTLYGGNGDDDLSGGVGFDTLRGESGADTLDGGIDNDTLYGGDGDDLLLGSSGTDTLYGENGNDGLKGGLGNDILLGGNGNDRYYWSLGEGDDTITDNYLETTANSTLFLEDVSLFERVEFTPSGSYALLVAVAGQDGPLGSLLINDWARSWNGVFHSNTWSVDLGELGRFQFINRPTSGADTVTGTSVGELLIGWTGDDALSGGAGNDFLQGGDGVDVLSGGTGADLLMGGAGNDILRAQESSDTSDVSNDVLAGGTGDDNLYGSAGNERYVVNLGDGHEIITEPNVAVLDEENQLLFGPGIDPNKIVVTRAADDLVIAYEGANGSVTIRNWFLENHSSQVESIHFANQITWDASFAESRVGLGAAHGDGNIDEPPVLDDEDVEDILDGYVAPAATALEVLTPLQ